MENFLGWFLESSLLVLMVAGIRRLFAGKVPYGAIYALWLVVVLRFLVPVGFISVPFSVANIFSEIYKSEQKQSGTGQDGSAFFGSSGENSRQADNRQVKNKDIQGTATNRQNINDGQKIDNKVNENIVNKNSRYEKESVEDRERNISLEISANSQNLTQIAWIVWFVGTATVFFFLILSNTFLLIKVKKSRVLYCCKGNIKVYSSMVVKSPCLYGLFCPAIYLPDSLVTSGRVEYIEQILTHEYVHYRHLDHIWSIARIVLVSVYWFDPFVWLMVSLSKKDAELFCDETVLRLIGEKKRFSYAKMLLELACETNWRDFSYFIMPVSRKGKDMEKRICAISQRKNYPRWLLVPFVVLLAISAGVTSSVGINPKNVKNKEVGSYLSITYTTSDSSAKSGRVMNFYTYDTDSKELDNKAQIPFNSQYALGAVSLSDNKVYYSSREKSGLGEADHLYEYNISNGQSALLENKNRAYNDIIPVNGKLLVTTVQVHAIGTALFDLETKTFKHLYTKPQKDNGSYKDFQNTTRPVALNYNYKYDRFIAVIANEQDLYDEDIRSGRKSLQYNITLLDSALNVKNEYSLSLKSWLVYEAEAAAQISEDSIILMLSVADNNNSGVTGYEFYQINYADNSCQKINSPFKGMQSINNFITDDDGKSYYVSGRNADGEAGLFYYDCSIDMAIPVLLNDSTKGGHIVNFCMIAK